MDTAATTTAVAAVAAVAALQTQSPCAADDKHTTNMNLEEYSSIASIMQMRHDAVPVNLWILHKNNPIPEKRTMSNSQILLYVQCVTEVDDKQLRLMEAQAILEAALQQEQYNHHHSHLPCTPTAVAPTESLGARASGPLPRSATSPFPVDHLPQLEKANTTTPFAVNKRLNSLSRYNLSLRAQDIHELSVESAEILEPIVAVRRLCIVFRVEPYRAVILRDRVILFLTNGMDGELEKLDKSPLFGMAVNQSYHKTGDYMTPTTTANRPQPQPYFEFQVLATFLDLIVRRESSLRDSLTGKISRVLDIVNTSRTSNVSAEIENLRILRNDVSRGESLLNRLRFVLNDLLYDEDELKYMQITRLMTEPELFWNKADHVQAQRLHEGAEVFIETYVQDLSEVQGSLMDLRQQMDYTEDSLKLRMDLSRNRIVAVNVIITIAATGVAIGSLVGAIEGMNLGINDFYRWHYTSFVWFVTVTVVVMVLSHSPSHMPQ